MINNLMQNRSSKCLVKPRIHINADLTGERDVMVSHKNLEQVRNQKQGHPFYTASRMDAVLVTA